VEGAIRIIAGQAQVACRHNPEKERSSIQNPALWDASAYQSLVFCVNVSAGSHCRGQLKFARCMATRKSIAGMHLSRN